MIESLVFIYRSGCEACEAAIPELEKFASDHATLPMIKISADGPFPRSMLGLKSVKVTPIYVFRRNGEAFSRIGMMKSKEIEKWIGSIGGDE